MNIYPSATQKLPPALWTISRASIARMSKSPRRGHIACEFWKIEDVAWCYDKGNHNYHIADLVVNYGISNTIVLEIPYVTTKTGISNRDAIVYN